MRFPLRWHHHQQQQQQQQRQRHITLLCNKIWFISCTFLLLVLLENLSLVSGIKSSSEITIGQWNMTIHSMPRFDLTKLFPRNNDNNYYYRHHHHYNVKNTNQAVNNIKKKNSINCILTLNANGTFCIEPIENQNKQQQQQLKKQKQSMETHVPLRGKWKVLSNPYCVTDRHYDQLTLRSYPRVHKRRPIKNNNIIINKNSAMNKKKKKLIKSPFLTKIPLLKKQLQNTSNFINNNNKDDNVEELETIRLEMNCRVWGRYSAGGIQQKLFTNNKNDYLAAKLTHGTLRWDVLENNNNSNKVQAKSSNNKEKVMHHGNQRDANKKQQQHWIKKPWGINNIPWKRRKIVATFSGNRRSSSITTAFDVVDDVDYFGY